MCLFRFLVTMLSSTSLTTVTMLSEKTGSHDNVEEDAKTTGDLHHLRLDLELPGDDPDSNYVEQDHRHQNLRWKQIYINIKSC